MKSSKFDSYMHSLLVLFLVGAGFQCLLRFTFCISLPVRMPLYSVSKQVDILQKFESWCWLIHISSSNCVSKTSTFSCQSAAWEHWQFRFVNPSDANSSAGSWSNADVCKEILQRALIFAVQTVCFCNPYLFPLSENRWVFMGMAEGMVRETTKCLAGTVGEGKLSQTTSV